MEEAEKERLIDAYRRIDQCLNGRFEKDVRLYLPMEDIEELKKIIYQGKYEKIIDKFNLKRQRYSAEVLANVIIKNAWLMKDDKAFRILRPIFEECDIDYFSAIMNDGILNHTIEMPKKFRTNIILMYLKRLDADTCKKLLAENPLFLNDMSFRSACIYPILKDKSLADRYAAFNDYVKKWPGLLEVSSDYKELFPKEQVNEEGFCHLIFENQVISDSNFELNQFWINKLNIDGLKIILSLLKDYFRDNASNQKKGKNVVSRLFVVINRDLSALPELADAFVTACTNLDKTTCNKVIQYYCEKTKSPEAKKILQQVLDRHAIHIDQRKNELQDIEGITEILNDNRYISDGLMGYLVISFYKQYQKEYLSCLSDIQSNCNNENNFNDFAYELATRRLQVFPNYMLYLLEYVVPYDEKIKNKCLQYFKDHDILREKGKLKLSKKVVQAITDFIKSNDFELFKKLTY